MGIPRWAYGNGWTVHVDLSAMDGAWTTEQAGACWAELCAVNDALGSNTAFVLRMQTYPPEGFYPGYYSRAQVLRTGDWMVNANGTTPANAAEWSDPWRSPYYTTPTCWVKGGPGTLDPVVVAHQVVHELFHLHMPYGQHNHNTDVGWVFGATMTPIQGVKIVTPEAGRRLQVAVADLARGSRVMQDAGGVTRVLIPHPLGAGMPTPEPVPGMRPRNGGGLTRASDGKMLDPSGFRANFR